MRTVTRKHLTVVGGIAKFAQVTVGRTEQFQSERRQPEPPIILNGGTMPALSDRDREIIEAARRGIAETEIALGWQGPEHFVVTIEGLVVDGIDSDAARLAASEATREMIRS